MLIASAILVPSSAADQKIIYAQDFESVSSFSDVGWEAVTVLNQPSAVMTIVDDPEGGKELLVDNMPEDLTKSLDSYYVIVPESIMNDVIKDDYTVQYDLRYLDSGALRQYLAVLLNYNPATSTQYVALSIQMRGHTNYFKLFIDGVETHLDRGGTDFGDIYRKSISCAIGAEQQEPGYAFSKVVFDLEPSNTEQVLKDKKMTVRVEVSVSDKIARVFVNDIYVTGTNGRTADGWEFFTWNTSSAIALKAAGNYNGTHNGIKATIDNIVVATGIGIPADAFSKPADTKPAETTVAPVTTDAPVTTAAPTVTPETADSTVVVLTTAVIIMAAAIILVTKRLSTKGV